MKKIYLFLLCIHVFVGIGAIGGGTFGVLNPTGIPTDILKKGPFNDFLIPSLFLLVVIGVGNIVAAILVSLQFKYQAYISGVFGGILVLWIIIQCFIMEDIVPLHVIFFVIGIVIGVLSIILAFKENLFPTQIIRKVLKKDRSV